MLFGTNFLENLNEELFLGVFHDKTKERLLNEESVTDQVETSKEMNITESEWFGYRRIDFLFLGRDAILIFPKEPADGNPWAQYTEYFGAFPDTALALIDRGYHLAFIQNKHRWGLEEDYLLKKEFGQFLHETYGLSKRSTLLGMSCGGLIAVHVAVRFPEYVEALYLDAPVINLLSCPFALGTGKLDPALSDECLSALHTTLSEMICFRGHPLDELPALAATQIPVALVYGSADLTVPYAENGALVEKAYREAGCPVRVWEKPGCDHHPHGLDDPSPVVEQLESWRRMRATME